MKVARGHPLQIEARVLAASKRFITAEVDFRRPDGEMIVRASGQQILLPRREA